MEIISLLIDFILRIDVHLAQLVQDYGTFVYVVLFAIIFVETGFVVMPFLPGDSLLFVVGALAATGALDLPTVMILLLIAAISGDQCNYSIGRYFGPKVFHWENSRFFIRRGVDRAHDFYELYGGVTIVLGRFMPFVRTFAPFVAGVAEMDRRMFTLYNVFGAVVWVVGVSGAGYLFGNLPWVKENLEFIIWGLILIPGLIAIWGGLKAQSTPKAEPPTPS